MQQANDFFFFFLTLFPEDVQRHDLLPFYSRVNTHHNHVLVLQRLYTSSRYSEEIKLLDQPPMTRATTPWPVDKTNPPPPPPSPHVDKDMLLTIVAPTCSGALFIICICAVVTYCMMRRKSKSKSVMMEPESKALMVDVPPYLVDPVEMRRQHYQTPGKSFLCGQLLGRVGKEAGFGNETSRVWFCFACFITLCFMDMFVK